MSADQQAAGGNRSWPFPLRFWWTWTILWTVALGWATFAWSGRQIAFVLACQFLGVCWSGVLYRQHHSGRSAEGSPDA